MENPVLVEVTRGPLVESRHRGAVAVSDPEGRTIFALGNVTAPVFPRSAVKALQALPLIEQGAADRFGLNDEELALACASHSGEAAHVAGVERDSVLPTCAAARIGRLHRPPPPPWRDPARRRRCITIVPANMRAFYALPARSAPILRIIGGRSIRCSG
jgi:hypothetical protein